MSPAGEPEDALPVVAAPPKKRKRDPELEAIDKMREAAFDPSMDAVWAKHPVLHTPENRRALCESLRMERAAWLMQEKRKKAKAAGGAPAATAISGTTEGEEDGTW